MKDGMELAVRIVQMVVMMLLLLPSYVSFYLCPLGQKKMEH